MWRNKNVWIILTGEAIVGLGLWTSIIANLEFMQQQIPSNFIRSLILFVGLLAGVLAAPLAGRIIDTRSKKSVLFYSGIGRLVSVSFMFLALYFNSIWWMVLFAISLQISATFYLPTLQAIIPLITKDKDLLKLNGVHLNVMTISRVAGTALGGMLLLHMSLYTLYLTSFIAYIFLIICNFFLTINEDGQSGKERINVHRGGFKEIFPALKKMPLVVRILWLTIVPTFFIGGFNLNIIQISELQGDPTIKSWLYAVEGISFIGTGFLVKKLTAGRDSLKLLYLFAFIIAMAQTVMYFAEIPAVSLVSFGLFGIGAGCFFPLVATTFQREVPKELHGRFFSFRNMLDRMGFQIVLLSTGVLLDTIGYHNMILLFGFISIAVTVTLFVRERRRVKEIQDPGLEM
jgi:MFS family permease